MKVFRLVIATIILGLMIPPAFVVRVLHDLFNWVMPKTEWSSPLDTSPPDDFTTPRWSLAHRKYIVECPNGEVLEFETREGAWKMWKKLRWGI